MGTVGIMSIVPADVPGDWNVTVSLWYSDVNSFTNPPNSTVIITVAAPSREAAQAEATQWGFERLAEDAGSGSADDDDDDNDDDDGDDDDDDDDEGDDDGDGEGDPGLGGGHGGGCFVENTLVAMSDHSHRAIKEITPGAMILSPDETGENFTPQRVLAHRISKVRTTIALKLSTGETVQTSTKQRLALQDGQYVPAKDIQMGARLRSFAGRDVRVVAKLFVKRPLRVHWLDTEHKRDIVLERIVRGNTRNK